MFKKIIFISVLSISYLVSAQNATTSEIIISEENLIFLLQKLKQKKAENELLQQQQQQQQQNNLESNSTNNPFFTNERVVSKENQTVSSNSNQLNEISSQLLALRYEIKYLNSQLSLKNNKNTGEDFIILNSPTNNKAVNPSTTNQDVYKLQKDLELLEINYKNDLEKLKLDAKNTALASKNEVLRKEIESKKEKIAAISLQDKTTTESLQEKTKSNQSVQPEKAMIANVTKSGVTPVETKSIRDQQNVTLSKQPEVFNENEQDFMKPINQKKGTNEIIVFESSFSSEYKALVEKYGSIKKQVFFENNSSEINSEYIESLTTSIDLLKTEEHLDVYLIGFASQKGNPMYNQKLSARRTEAIKEFFISKGIHPTRILTQYHGIDYKAKDEAAARRVNISYIIRK